MSIAEKLTQIAENEQKVYDAGYSKGELTIWNCITNYGDRTNYYNAFLNTDFSGMTIPTGLCKPKSRLSYMFNTYKGTTLPENIDCSEFDVSKAEAYHAASMFSYAWYLTEIYDLKIPAQKTYVNFALSCSALTKIEVMRSDENTVWANNTFNSCGKLEYLRIDGVIGKDFYANECTSLDHDSLMSIINALKNIKDTGTTLTVTLGSVNLAKLTDAEKAIATTEKGWTLA